MLKISMLLTCENWNSYSKSNESRNDFTDNLYNHGLPMSSAQLLFLNNILKTY